MTHNDFDGLLEEMGQHLSDGARSAVALRFRKQRAAVTAAWLIGPPLDDTSYGLDSYGSLEPPLDGAPRLGAGAS